jgi:hypothetical protein
MHDTKVTVIELIGCVEPGSKAPMVGGVARAFPQISVAGAPTVVPAPMAGELATGRKLKLATEFQ